MWLEQAVFTSSKTRHGEGYQVVARSPGISNEVMIALTRWCPSHASLQSIEVDTESLNYHPLTAELVAVSRTTYGLKEFSGRGGLQVVTMAIVLRRRQLVGYRNDAFCFARVARSLGHLRWRPNVPERLSAIELPSTEESESLVPASVASQENDCSKKAADLLRAGQRVALVAGSGTRQLAEEIIQRVPVEDRPACYFTTALKWSKQRPFRLQMLNDIDPQVKVNMRNNSQNTLVVVAGPGSAESAWL